MFFLKTQHREKFGGRDKASMPAIHILYAALVRFIFKGQLHQESERNPAPNVQIDQKNKPKLTILFYFTSNLVNKKK